MRIGLMAGATAATGNSLKDIVEFSKTAEQRGFDNVWVANAFGFDAIGAIAIAGWETSRIQFGTAVTPTYPRHPMALAQQALTTSVACDGRFTLGIGLSHKLVIEDMFGMSYDKPAKHMREYIAALGPLMLKIAGTYADGTTLWVTGPKTIAEHIVPTISKAATAAGKAAPRIVAGLPIVVTKDVKAAKAKIAEDLKIYGMLPSYRAMLDREGAGGPEDVAIIGDAAMVKEGIAKLRDAGVTDFNAAIVPIEEGSLDATLDVLQSELS